MAASSARIVPIILAGGVGSRLWPVSRRHLPKQFHNLASDRTLLQDTVRRAFEATGTPPLIVCNEAHRFTVAEQCRAVDLSWDEIILEPEGRNSAPGIALAAWRVAEEDPDSLLLVLSSDHVVPDHDAFAEAVKTAATGAADGGLVTFGIQPTRPETGFGYLKIGDAAGGLQPVQAFVEKPELATAEAYVASGDYLWNSGMFLFQTQAFLNELTKFAAPMAEATKTAMQDARRDLDFLWPSAAFLESPAESIDYAVMEKTDAAMVVPVAFDWHDLGSWDGLCEVVGVDDQGNVQQGDVVAVDVADSVVIAQSRMVAALGLEGVVVIETPDAVMVTRRDRAQDVRLLVKELEQLGREEAEQHRRVLRPWGSYESIAMGERFQVKRIAVRPGHALSLQSHEHRSEHWIVVKGEGRVRRGDDEFTLRENESTYIPVGAIHRLQNDSDDMLELVEVQVGGYLGEDDIKRYEDRYGRKPSG